MRNSSIKPSRKKVFLFLFLILAICSAQGQNFMPGIKNSHHGSRSSINFPVPPELTISYNEKVTLDPQMVGGYENAAWTITGPNEFSHTGYNLQELKDFVFTTPGNFVINFLPGGMNQDENSTLCFHDSYPETINVTVSNYRLIFLYETITFSNTIQAGQPTNGIQLSINVTLQSYDGSSLIYDNPVKSAGINTSIAGTLSQAATLSPGSNTLNFQLSGSVLNPNTYISFDFFDNVKGCICPFYVTNPIL